MTSAYVHSTETFGSVDGPGVRFILFLQGCRMRCRYCHNPDSWKIGTGDVMEPEAILRQALRYQSYWGDEGGITVSGGEPLLQLDFMIEFFELAKAEGVNTTIDTAGEPFERTGENFAKIERLMKSTDLVMLDIKHIDEEAHKRLTGHSNENILDFARWLDEIGKPVWIRHVLVPGWTDGEGALKRLRAFIDTLSNVKKVEVLPFHNLAAFKWQTLGIKYTLKDTLPPSAESVAKAVEILGAVPRN